jgi:hypothetical protein
MTNTPTIAILARRLATLAGGALPDPSNATFAQMQRQVGKLKGQSPQQLSASLNTAFQSLLNSLGAALPQQIGGPPMTIGTPDQALDEATNQAAQILSLAATASPVIGQMISTLKARPLKVEVDGPSGLSTTLPKDLGEIRDAANLIASRTGAGVVPSSAVSLLATADPTQFTLSAVPPYGFSRGDTTVVEVTWTDSAKNQGIQLIVILWLIDPPAPPPSLTLKTKVPVQVLTTPQRIDFIAQNLPDDFTLDVKDVPRVPMAQMLDGDCLSVWIELAPTFNPDLKPKGFTLRVLDAQNNVVATCFVPLDSGGSKYQVLPPASGSSYRLPGEQFCLVGPVNSDTQAGFTPQK